jgi:hypothetical protein
VEQLTRELAEEKLKTAALTAAGAHDCQQTILEERAIEAANNALDTMLDELDVEEGGEQITNQISAEENDTEPTITNVQEPPKKRQFRGRRAGRKHKRKDTESVIVSAPRRTMMGAILFNLWRLALILSAGMLVFVWVHTLPEAPDRTPGKSSVSLYYKYRPDPPIPILSFMADVVFEDDIPPTASNGSWTLLLAGFASRKKRGRHFLL